MCQIIEITRVILTKEKRRVWVVLLLLLLLLLLLPEPTTTTYYNYYNYYNYNNYNNYYNYDCCYEQGWAGRGRGGGSSAGTRGAADYSWEVGGGVPHSEHHQGTTQTAPTAPL